MSGYSTGTWIWNSRLSYPASWKRIAEPQYTIYNLACGDRDGDGRAEVVGGYNTGIWLWDGYWKKRLTDPGYVTKADMEMGDFDKNGRDDLAVSFSDPPGLYINYDNGSWYKVYGTPPYRVTTGDLIEN